MEKAGELKDILIAPGPFKQGSCKTEQIQGCDPILRRLWGSHEDMKHRPASSCHLEVEKTSHQTPAANGIVQSICCGDFNLFF